MEILFGTAVEEAVGTLFGFMVIVVGGAWVVLQCKNGIESIGRTTKAIGKWNDKQLKK